MIGEYSGGCACVCFRSKDTEHRVMLYSDEEMFLTMARLLDCASGVAGIGIAYGVVFLLHRELLQFQ